MKKYKNKETGEIVSAEFHNDEICSCWILERNESPFVHPKVFAEQYEELKDLLEAAMAPGMTEKILKSIDEAPSLPKLPKIPEAGKILFHFPPEWPASYEIREADGHHVWLIDPDGSGVLISDHKLLIFLKKLFDDNF